MFPLSLRLRTFSCLYLAHPTWPKSTLTGGPCTGVWDSLAMNTCSFVPSALLVYVTHLLSACHLLDTGEVEGATPTLGLCSQDYSVSSVSEQVQGPHWGGLSSPQEAIGHSPPPELPGPWRQEDLSFLFIGLYL